MLITQQKTNNLILFATGYGSVAQQILWNKPQKTNIKKDTREQTFKHISEMTLLD